MMIAFNKQIINIMKHPLMPNDYPFHIYEIDDSMAASKVLEGYIVMDKVAFDAYKATFDLTAYNAAIAPTIDEKITMAINKAADFGNELTENFAKENVLMGITQAGKTEAVTKYLHFLGHYCEQGSLYAAVNEIDRLLVNLDTTMAPFITADRLNAFKLKLKVYLGLP